jgi:hypothetical protein
MTPRRAATVGIIFIVIAACYFALAPILGYNVDAAGVTMLLALGASMSIMAYVLMAGQRS